MQLLLGIKEQLAQWILSFCLFCLVLLLITFSQTFPCHCLSFLLINLFSICSVIISMTHCLKQCFEYSPNTTVADLTTLSLVSYIHCFSERETDTYTPPCAEISLHGAWLQSWESKKGFLYKWGHSVNTDSILKQKSTVIFKAMHFNERVSLE